MNNLEILSLLTELEKRIPDLVWNIHKYQPMVYAYIDAIPFCYAVSIYITSYNIVACYVKFCLHFESDYRDYSLLKKWEGSPEYVLNFLNNWINELIESQNLDIQKTQAKNEQF